MTEEPRAKDDLDAAADPRLLAALERWLFSARPFVQQIDVYLREMRLLLERRDWRYSGHFEVAEREIPFELTRDLMERMPQAKLRDLFRPEIELHWHEREMVVEPRDIAGARAMAEAKAQRRMQRPETVGSLLAVVKQEQQRRRAWLAEPWQPTLRDDQERKPVVPWS